MQILCPLCKTHPLLATPTTAPPGIVIDCEWCGKYWLEMSLIDACKQKYAGTTWRLAAYVKEKTLAGMEVAILPSQEQIQPNAPTGAVGIGQAIAAFPKTVSERFDRILLNLERMTSHLGAGIKIEQWSKPLLMAQNDSEVGFVMSSLTEQGCVAGYNSIIPCDIRLTAKGLERVASLQRGHFAPLSKQAFVAMSFDKTMNEAWQQGLKLGIEDCGYTAKRVDDIEHNGDICEVMLAEIRKSKFIVADFTDHKHGVYFEAGFMMGLGRPVIFTCREDEFKKAHFDTNHYNHITWQTVGELREKLKRRIQESIAP